MATRKIRIRIDGKKYLVTGLSRQIFQKDFLCSLAGEEANLPNNCCLAEVTKICLGNDNKTKQFKRVNKRGVLSRAEKISHGTGNQGLNHPITSLVKAGIRVGGNADVNREGKFMCTKSKSQKQNKSKSKTKDFVSGCGKKQLKKAKKKAAKFEGKGKLKASRSKTVNDKIAPEANKSDETPPDEVNSTNCTTKTEASCNKSEDSVFETKTIITEKDIMSFECSKEKWIDEIRRKSPIYAIKDENQNYVDSKKGDRSDSEADIDSGIPSIDGDIPQEKVAVTKKLIEDEFFLLRQDSGLSSESSENSSSSTAVRFNYDNVLATNNKRLLSKDFGKQVVFNDHNRRTDVNRRGKESRDTHVSSHYNNNDNDVDGDDIRKSGYRKKGVAETGCAVHGSKQRSQFTSSAKVNTFGKACDLREETSQDLMKICSSAGGPDSNRSNLDKHLMSENNTIAGLCFENTQPPSNRARRTEATQIDLAGVDYHRKDSAFNKIHSTRRAGEQDDIRRYSEDSGYSDSRDGVKTAPRKNDNDNQATVKHGKRALIWKEYIGVTRSLSEILDRLLYSDLMIANLTADILNFSTDHYSIEDDLEELEVKYLKNEVFDMHSLLQTAELIADKQCVERHFLGQQIGRTQREIDKKRLTLQSLQRLYRNRKFKTMPKHIKRYCSTESLLSDMGECNDEKHVHLEVLSDAEEDSKEVISFV
eukprot:gene17930-19718_t